MGIIIHPVPGSIDPASVQDEAERLKREAQAQLRQDYPTATFQDEATTPAPTAEPAPLPGPRAPKLITVGNPNAKNELPESATPAPEKPGFVVGTGRTWVAKVKQRAADTQLMYHEERAYQNQLAAKRAEVLQSAVAEAKATNKNILDVPSVKAAAKELGLRPDMFVRHAEDYVYKTPEELKKISTEALATSEEQTAKAAPLLTRRKDLAAEIVAAHPEYKQWSAQNIAFDALTSAPDMVATIALGVVNPGAGATALFAQMVPMYYGEGRQAGMPREKAQTYGVLMAAGEAIPETAVLGRLSEVSLRRVVGESLIKAMGKEAVGVGLTEGVSEMVTEVYQQGLETGLYDKKTTVAQVLQDVAYAGVVGFAMGAPMGGVGGAATHLRANLPQGEIRPSREAQPPSTPPPPGPTTPPPGPAPAPPAAAGPAAAPAPGIPKPGDALLFQPNPSAPGAVVVIQSVSPQSRSAIVARVDPATGDPFLNADGDPESFVASFEDLKLSGVSPPSATQAAKPPAAAPPAATSAEPTSDIIAQVKDLWNAKTPRRGVYVSPATVTKMKAEGSYPDLLKTGVAAENFDGQGGTLVVKSKKDLEEAIAARDSGVVDMQEIVGRLTGAGIAKPKTSKAAVVQRKDETGAVVQQSAVEPAAVPAAVAAVKNLPGTVEVTTPEAVIAERETKVANEAAVVAKAPTRPAPGDAFGAADYGILFAIQTLNTPKEGNLTKTDVRASAQAVGAAAQMLRKAAVEAGQRGAPPEVVAAAAEVAGRIERIGDKPEQDFVKGRGVSEPKLRAKLVEIQNAFRALAEYRDKPKVVRVEPSAAAKVKAASKRAGPKIGESAALNKTGDKLANEVLNQPGMQEAVEKDKLAMREKVAAKVKAKEEAAKIKEQEARAAMPEKVREVVEKAERVFRKEQERRKVEGKPPEGTPERRGGTEYRGYTIEKGPAGTWQARSKESGLGIVGQKSVEEVKRLIDEAHGPQTGPTGIAVAPPGERVVHRKKKYIPPKKREPTAEEIAAKVAADTAPPQVEIIELAPTAVAGDEEAFITELMGATPEELQQELRLDPTGRMSAVLVDLVKVMGDRNSWASWFAAVTRGGVMDRSQRNQMMGLIREYAAVSRQDLPAVREKLLGLLTNINGKMLPQPAIAAVFEAANVTRAYTTMAQAMNDTLENPDSDLAQINEATGTTAFDPSLVKRDTGSLSTARENEIGGTARTKPVFEMGFTEELLKGMLKLSSDFAPIRKILDQLTAVSQTGRFMSGIMARSMQAQMSQSPLPGSHEILDGILWHAGQAKLPNSTLRFLHHIRAAMPDLPVEFVPHNQPMMDERGNTTRDPGGRFLGEGMLQVSVSIDSKGLPIWTTGRMQTLLHEMVHAATVYELNRAQSSQLIIEIGRLRDEITEKARGKIGPKKVNEILRFYRNEITVEPEGLKDFGPYLYGLTNDFELVAEGLTSPYFQQFLRSLDQTPTTSWYRSTWNTLVRAVSRLLGFKNPADNRILNDLMLLSMRTMTAQRGRQQRIQAARDKAITEIQQILKLPVEKIAPVVDSLFTGDKGLTVLEEPHGYVYSHKAQMPRGSVTPYGVESNDRMAFRAYTSGPEQLGNRIRGIRERATLGTLEAPPYLKNHEQIAAISTPRLANALAGVRRLMTSRFVDSARDRGLGFLTTDFLVSRGARLFGNELDSANPLIAWKRLRDLRRTYSNQLAELAEKTVNSKWMKMNPFHSEQIGTMLQQTTLWQIDPEQGLTQQKLLPNTSQKAWTAKVNELNAAWAKLDNEQKDLYRSVQKYFKQEYSQIRRAGIDLAIDLFGGQITAQQRTMLYTLRNADGIDALVGTGLFIDLGELNEKFRKVVRDLIRVSAIRGPYFPLMRKGNLVVEAAREGILNDDQGRPRNFDLKAAAQAQVDEIRARAPKNTARVVEEGGKFQVKYKIRHVSFHMSQAEAQDAQAQLRQQGFEVGVYTRKLESVESANMSEGLKELISKAESVANAGGVKDAEQQLIIQTLQSAFVQILAERAASASQQLKRQGVEGFKGKEAHEIFARRVKASSWHYANLKTALAQSKALSRLRTFARDPSQGKGPPHVDAQGLALSRGRTLSEITKRLRVEADELDSLDRSNMDFYLGQLGFINFLATPSYILVNSMQNFNVALPYITGKYGLRGAKALLRGMKVITGPAFAKAMRGVVSKPGEVTVYDVYSAIAEAVAEHPRYAKFTVARGNKPSALQELVDMGVINASFVQELAAVANNQSLTISRGMEWLRLFPQGAELWNRISTALAVLEVTDGNVEAAADVVRKVHFGYEIENRPRYFRKVGGTRLPQAITMFKMYGVGMYQLTGSLIVDTISRRGQTRADRGRAATALAGIIAAHVLSAGVVGGIMLEPLRLLMQLWHALFGDDDEYFDLDTRVQLWAKEVTESDLGGRILSHGLWNALGFDLSGRMGLDRILMYDPPESFTEDEMWKMIGGLLGPIPSMLIQKSARAYQLAAVYGKPYEAIMEAIPVRALQDARKAWKLITEGVTSSTGDVVSGPENFGWLSAAGRAAGFQTTEEARLSDQAATTFGYRGWRTARVRQLTTAFWRASDAGDAQAEAEAVADIEAFNRKNPGAPITAQSLRQSKQSTQRNIRERTGEGRNEDLNKLLNY